MKKRSLAYATETCLSFVSRSEMVFIYVISTNIVDIGFRPACLNMKEYVPNCATKHNNPRHLKYDKIKSQTTKYAMSLLRTLQISNNDVNSLLSNNFPLS